MSELICETHLAPSGKIISAMIDRELLIRIICREMPNRAVIKNIEFIPEFEGEKFRYRIIVRCKQRCDRLPISLSNDEVENISSRVRYASWVDFELEFLRPLRGSAVLEPFPVLGGLHERKPRKPATKREPKLPHPKKREWNGLTLTARAHYTVTNEGCITIEDAQKVPFSEWKRRPNCGDMTAREIVSAVNGIDDSKKGVWGEFKRAIMFAGKQPETLSEGEMIAIIAKFTPPSP